jgi:myosin heavy subunit
MEIHRRTREAMNIMGFSAEEQWRVLKVTAAVLHLGNLRFTLLRECHAAPLHRCRGLRLLTL